MRMMNPMHKDFAMVRAKLKYLYQSVENNQTIKDEDFAALQEEISGIPWIDECRLYRYSLANEDNVSNLCKQQIHLSPVNKLNDAFEDVPYDVLSENSAKRLDDSMYIKCFTEEPNEILMWAHYAEGCRGMCVEYNLALLDSDHEVFKFFFPIYYSRRRYKGTDPENIMAHYLIKGKEWEYEKEWRIAVPAKYMEGHEAKFPDQIIELKCITAVYLGYRMPEEIKRRIKKAVKDLECSEKREIPVKEIKLDDEEYKYLV